VAATGLLGFNPYNTKGLALDISSKPTNLAIQLQQKEQAKKEALDKYFMDYEKTLNSAGMRQQDQDVFLNKLGEAKQYYLQNRDKILNPAKYGAEFQSEYNAKLRNTQNTISQSKQLAANGKVLAPLIIDSRKNNRTIPKEITDALYKNELSMGDPNHIAFDPINFDAYDKHDPFKYQQAIYSRIKPSESLPIKHEDKNTHEIFYETKNDIDKNSFGEIQNVVASELQKDRGLIDTTKEIAKDDNKLNKLAKVYEDFSGKKMDRNSLNDIATAYTIAIKPAAQIKYTTPKEDAEFRRLQAMSDAKEMARYRKGLGVEDGGLDPVDDYLKQAKSNVTFGGETGKDIVKLTLPSKIADEFKENKQKQTPIIGQGLNSNKYYLIKFQNPKETGGKTDVIDWTKTTEIPEVQLRGLVTSHVFPSKGKINTISNKGKSVSGKYGDTKFN